MFYRVELDELKQSIRRDFLRRSLYALVPSTLFILYATFNINTIGLLLIYFFLTFYVSYYLLTDQGYLLRRKSLMKWSLEGDSMKFVYINGVIEPHVFELELPVEHIRIFYDRRILVLFDKNKNRYTPMFKLSNDNKKLTSSLDDINIKLIKNQILKTSRDNTYLGEKKFFMSA